MSGKRGPRIPKPLQSVHRHEHISQADMHVTVLPTHFYYAHTVPAGIRRAYTAKHLRFFLYGERNAFTLVTISCNTPSHSSVPPLNSMVAFKGRVSSFVTSVLSPRDVNSNTGWQIVKKKKKKKELITAVGDAEPMCADNISFIVLQLILKLWACAKWKQIHSSMMEEDPKAY